MNNWMAKDLKDKGIAKVNGPYQKLVTNKPAQVKKLPNLLERAIPNKKVMDATKSVVDMPSTKIECTCLLNRLLYDKI